MHTEANAHATQPGRELLNTIADLERRNAWREIVALQSTVRTTRTGTSRFATKIRRWVAVLRTVDAGAKATDRSASELTSQSPGSRGSSDTAASSNRSSAVLGESPN